MCFLVINYIIIVPARAALVKCLVAFSLYKSFSSRRVCNFTLLSYVFVIQLLIESAYWSRAKTDIPNIYTDSQRRTSMIRTCTTERKTFSLSLFKKPWWRFRAPYLLLVWKTWRRAEFMLSLNVLSLLHTYKCVTRSLLLVVFTMVPQSYIKEKENCQDVKKMSCSSTQVILWTVSIAWLGHDTSIENKIECTQWDTEKEMQFLAC